MENITYKEALKQLEELVSKIESADADLTTLSDDVKRALELVEYCREQIRGYSDKCEKLLEQR